ncbi:hypothetical protein ACVBEQ_14110 [Nakamurella sp. GG22]
MAQRPGSHRADHASPLVDLDVVFADDRLIDSIAAGDPLSPERADHEMGLPGRHSAGRQPAGPFGRGRHTVHTKHSGRPSAGTVDRPDADPLTELFQTWRYELASEPLPPVPSVRRAADAVVSGTEERKRSLRPALSIAAAIVALLIGSATVGSKDADEDSALWGITQVLWPERAVSVASRDHVRQALDEATVALAAGDPQQAQLALLRAAVELGKVADVDGKSGMQQEVDQLWRAAAPRELSGTSLTADPMTEQMLADGQSTSPVPSVAEPSTSGAPQSLPSRSLASLTIAPPAVASPDGGSYLAGQDAGAVVPDPSRPLNVAGPAVPAPSEAGSGPVSGPTGGGGVASAGTVVAPPPAGPSATPLTPPPVTPPPVTPPPVTPPPVTPPPAPVTPVTSAAPEMPTPPVVVEPPPAEVPAGSVSLAPSTIGTTAPAPAPAPTTTGTGPIDDTSTTTTPAGSDGSEPPPQPPAEVSPAG